MPEVSTKRSWRRTKLEMNKLDLFKRILGVEADDQTDVADNQVHVPPPQASAPSPIRSRETEDTEAETRQSPALQHEGPCPTVSTN